MLKNKDIVCISSIDWDFIWQGPQEIMSTLAKNGNRVLFIENLGVRSPRLKDFSRIRSRLRNWFKGVKGIRKLNENLYIFSPIVFPFPYSRFFLFLNKLILRPILKGWMRVFNFESPVTWVFLPTNTSLELLDILNSELVIYYCVDRFAFSSDLARKIKASEGRLVNMADLLFVSTKSLAQDLRCRRDDAHVFYFGVNVDNFERQRDVVTPVPEDLSAIKTPIVGYIGGVHKFIDFTLLKDVIKAHPEWSFVFVGPLQTDVSVISSFSNVHFLGQKRYDELPLYMKCFNVGIIPYVLTDYTEVGRPTKLNEYLIMDKPVVSTNMSEVAHLSVEVPHSVMVAKNAFEFAEMLGRAIAQKKGQFKDERVSIAKAHSWAETIERMSVLVEGAIEQKRFDKDRKWHDAFADFFRNAKYRFARFAVFLAALYFIIFHSSFIWWVASPLKVQSALEHADTIVVFAGGVGESGRAGQGYEERVKYAVDLYKRGYADELIFSSGYSYAFKEADVMKALAISLGVPGKAIILEDSARNTYENVVNTAGIMSAKGFTSAIIISAPYHMRRITLVWDKIAPGKKRIAAPVKNSLFFGNGRTIKAEHIAAVVHEYIGVLYYKMRGYI